MKLKLTTDFASIQEYITDHKLIDGLFFTKNLKNIKRNLKAFKIQCPIGSLKITTINNYSILTLFPNFNEKRQYLITKKLNLEELSMIPDYVLEKDLKKYIVLTRGFSECISQ